MVFKFRNNEEIWVAKERLLRIGINIDFIPLEGEPKAIKEIFLEFNEGMIYFGGYYPPYSPEFSPAFARNLVEIGWMVLPTASLNKHFLDSDPYMTFLQDHLSSFSKEFGPLR